MAPDHIIGSVSEEIVMETTKTRAQKKKIKNTGIRPASQKGWDALYRTDLFLNG